MNLRGCLVFFIGLGGCGGDESGGSPCAGVVCGHGECRSEGASARCDCDAGYEARGLECVPAGGDADTDTDTDSDSDVDTDTDSDGGEYWHFVQDSVDLPSNVAEARNLGLDLDGDEVEDNAFGNVITVLFAQNVDLQVDVDEAIAAGALLVLYSVNADDLAADPSATLQTYLATDDATPDFSGRGAFAIAVEDPGDSILGGTLEGSQLDAGPGEVTIEVPAFGGTAVAVPLVAARVDTGIDDLGCTGGRLGGAIRAEDVSGILIPAWATGMQSVVDDDPGCPAKCGTSARSLLDLFDDDDDLQITTNEVQTDPLLTSLWAPDLDLLDAAGELGTDGIEDSISFGYGFTCVRATFDSPGEG